MSDISVLVERATVYATLIPVAAGEDNDSLVYSSLYSTLTAADFEDSTLADLYTSFCNVFRVYGRTSLALVLEDIQNRSNLTGEVLAPTLELCRDAYVSGGFSLADLSTLAATVKEYACRRRLAAVSSDTARLIQDSKSGKVSANAARDLIAVCEDVLVESSLGAQHLSSPAKQVSEFLGWLNDEGDVPLPLATPLQGLNDLLGGGLRPGELFVLAARPGGGKTTLALDFARFAAFDLGKSVLFKSLEMERSEIMNKVMSAGALVPLSYIQQTKHEDGEHKRTLLEYLEVMKNKGDILVIDDSSNNTLANLQGVARKQKASPQGIDLIIVDYLQLMTSGANVPRHEDISILSRSLKLIAKDLHIPIIAISQLNREPEKTRADSKVGDLEKGKPRIDHLRGSGSIEQDANQVAFIWHYSVKQDDSEDDGEPIMDDPEQWRFRLLLEKNRNGSTGSVKLLPLLHISTFNEIRDERNNGFVPGEPIEYF